jgi:hypothetical protein
MEEWKNNRAEIEIRLASEKIMKEAADKVKLAEDSEWDKICASIYVGSREDDDNIDWVISLLKTNYNPPTLK